MCMSKEMTKLTAETGDTGQGPVTFPGIDFVLDNLIM